MNTKEYIQSGVLELYAAGALSDTEAREVEAMAAQYPEVQAELAAIQDALVSYSASFKKNPNPELRSTILNRIDEIEGVSSANILSISDTQKKPNIADTTGKSSFNYTQQPARFNYLMAAVWIFLVLNIIGNIYFFNKLKNTEEQMTGVVNENYKMKLEYEKIRLDMDKKSTDMKMVMNRSNKIVDLKGMEIAPQSFATVYWNPNSKKVMLNVNSLPMPPADKQYQLWALKDGKPIDAGVFDMQPGTGDDMHMMPVTIADADAFAVTLEKKGGSPAPTLTQLYVMGKI
ncbi:MAG: anti-sigma factor [Ignavibacteria bacterium]|nr:anti-sigma factor [Ignavibacteria bacterium]